MGDAQCTQPPSANLKKALRWVSEMVQSDCKKNRAQLIREAELRFDLTPVECEFLDQNFSREPGNN
ncbi:hypothetical protein [Desulfolithobacter sp.]